MSLIFDALQRSEAERSGVDLSLCRGRPRCCELAESHVVSEQNTAIASEKAAERSAGRDKSFAVRARPSTAAAEGPASVEPSRSGEHPDIFAQFQSQQVVVSTERQASLLHRQRKSRGGTLPLPGNPLATSEAGKNTEESAYYEHNPRRGQEYGICQPCLHPRSKNAAKDLAGRGRSTATDFVTDVRVGDASRASVSACKRSAI